MPEPGRWRRLPLVLRIAIVALAAVVVVVVLFTIVFPRIEGLLEDPTLGVVQRLDGVVALAGVRR